MCDNKRIRLTDLELSLNELNNIAAKITHTHQFVSSSQITFDLAKAPENNVCTIEDELCRCVHSYEFTYPIKSANVLIDIVFTRAHTHTYTYTRTQHSLRRVLLYSEAVLCQWFRVFYLHFIIL